MHQMKSRAYNFSSSIRIWDFESCRAVLDLPPHPSSIASLLLLPLPPPPVPTSSHPHVLLLSADVSSNVNMWLISPGLINSPPMPSAAPLCLCQLQLATPEFDAELVSVAVVAGEV
jgi:hypothetical protein